LVERSGSAVVDRLVNPAGAAPVTGAGAGGRGRRSVRGRDCDHRRPQRRQGVDRLADARPVTIAEVAAGAGPIIRAAVQVVQGYTTLGVQMSETRSAVETSAKLAELVYELLDAHDDTARLAQESDCDVRWAAHLDYLQQLQRIGREVLAESVADGSA
jgi:hypothetical protein